MGPNSCLNFRSPVSPSFEPPRLRTVAPISWNVSIATQTSCTGPYFLFESSVDPLTIPYALRLNRPTMSPLTGWPSR